jgi:large subunit ribosomal protein L3
MKFILGKKINMTQFWDNDKVVAVTKVQAGPCIITQVKDDSTDNYKAIQLAYGERKPKNISKSVRGHLKKAGIEKENSRHLREFRVSEIKPEMKTGGVIDVSIFSKGDIVDVTGTSKGKGFQGVVRRHGFSGSKKTHGNKDQLRASGSIGALGPAHVFKGTRMGGRMGGDHITMKNLEIVDVDLENNILFIKGAVPGCESGFLMIKGDGDLVIKDKNEKNIKEIKEIITEETENDTEINNEAEEPKEKEESAEEVKSEDIVKKTEEGLSEK